MIEQVIDEAMKDLELSPSYMTGAVRGLYVKGLMPKINMSKAIARINEYDRYLTKEIDNYPPPVEVKYKESLQGFNNVIKFKPEGGQARATTLPSCTNSFEFFKL